MTEDAESGMMQSMVTITHNDMSPEMLAAARRGPFAAPTDSEMIEYLMQRVKSDSQRPRFEELGSRGRCKDTQWNLDSCKKTFFLTSARGLEHVLSYQRRVHATKQSFLKRNVLTPLGIARDWWDRKGIVYAFVATYLI